MKVDLNPLPYKTALDTIQWCFDRDIDKEKCVELIHSMSVKPVPDIDWTLDIPDKHVTFLLLKWSGLELS